MRLFAAFVIATLSGFIALSYEILWVRIYSFLTESSPEAFGYLLGSYLTGIAVGSLVARFFCGRADNSARDRQLLTLSLFMAAANILGFLVIPVIAAFAPTWENPEIWPLWIIGSVSALLGTTFPLVAHFAIPADERVGARLSYLYVGNILGSSAGSLATGFWLLDVLTLRSLAIVLALMGLAVSAVLLLASPGNRKGRVFVVGGLVTVAAVLVSFSHPLYYAVYEKLQYKDDYEPGVRFAELYEGRSGVVAVSASGTVYGGGSYDGQLNTSPLPDRDGNRVIRAYSIAAFHPDPKHVLMIGLGSGSWLQALANHPDLESVTVVEINSGYAELASRSPLVASALTHPKVKIVFDDGRRFLRRTSHRFDVIVQSHCVYWRAHATNLLSREYLELARQHLNKGGVLFYNTTSSTASQKTGATVFPYAWRFQNMLIVGDSPIEIDRDRWRQKLLQWKIDGQKVIDIDCHADDLEVIVGQEMWRGVTTWEDRDSILLRTQDDPIITDDNMASEWWAYDTYPEDW